MSVDAARRLRQGAAAGALAFATLAVLAPLGWDDDGVAARALLLAVLATIPLGLALAIVPDRRGAGHDGGLLRLLAWGHAPAAALAAAGLLLPRGPLAGALCTPWLAYATVAAAWGVLRFLRRPWPLAEEVAADAAAVFLANGAFFLLAWRAGLDLGLPPFLLALTAIHFHYASFAIPLMLAAGGRLLRRGRSRPFAAAVVAVLVGLPVTAAGILASPRLETVGAVLVAGAGLAAAGLALRAAASWRRPAASVLLAVAGAAALGGMALAAAYGLRWVQPEWAPPWRMMVLAHSALNALGFTACGLLGWTLLRPAPRTAPPGLPVSRLRATGPVGADFLERAGAVDPDRPAPRGLVADLGAFASARFRPDGVHPTLRAFYEDTAAFHLDVAPQWARGPVPALGRRLWSGLGRRLGQMDFPQAGEEGLVSRLVAVRGAADGRDDVRGWVRTRADGRTLYVAAYSTHAWDDERYANIAFPLRGGCLTSVLRWQDLPGRPGGVLLTTHPGTEPGDQGVYLVLGGRPLRLPINETIAVWVEAGGARARHDIRVLGLPFLVLHYRMAAKAAAPV